MTVPDTPGDRLSKALKRAGIKNQELAKALDVDNTTVSRWKHDVQTPDDSTLDRIVAHLAGRNVLITASWIRYGESGAPSLREPLAAYSGDELQFGSATAAQRARIWREQFVLELIEEGADEDFVGFARRFLRSPENYVMYKGGAPEEMSDEEKLRHMQGLAVGVRAILKDRLKKGKVNEKTRSKQD